ncbi:MAG: hypothetical protein AAGC80_32315 [Rhodococcus sp. (in: high G+C Gram-positive bacteria)]
MAQVEKRAGGHQSRTGRGRTARPHDDTPKPAEVVVDPPMVGVRSKPLPRKGPRKVQLNTRVLASTEARLNWLAKNRNFSVTSVVDVALQEFFDRYDVPPADPDGRIGEQ